MSVVAPEFRRPARPAPARRVAWLSGRSMLLHLTLVLVGPVCLLAGWWQLQRALSGNTLSFVYVFEWPAFAGVAVWAWWALLTAPARNGGPPGASQPPAPSRADLLAARTAPLRWDSGQESARLRAYNAYLADLRDRPRRGRLPRRPPGGRRA